ncbi:hypothetical protein J6590_090987 [Homalodisca vitripennis]|nr:hypothetical protein J6590_090987 [Homalodisca vitripennis]
MLDIDLENAGPKVKEIGEGSLDDFGGDVPASNKGKRKRGRRQRNTHKLEGSKNNVITVHGTNEIS